MSDKPNQLDEDIANILHEMQVEEYGIVSQADTVKAIKALIAQEVNKARIELEDYKIRTEEL